MNTEINQIIQASLYPCAGKMYALSNPQQIYDEMRIQTILPLTGDLLPKLTGIPEELRQRWKDQVVSQVHDFDKYMHRQSQVVALLREHKIPFAVMKGSSAAWDYPRPEYRPMGDIDLLVHPENWEKAQEVLVENGFEEREDSEAKRLKTFKKGKTKVELHWSFDQSTEKDEISLRDQLLFSGLANCKDKELAGFYFPRLPVLQHGIVLLAHIQFHMSSGLGYRQMIDWMMYADHYLSDDYWEKEFAPIVQKLHMMLFAKTVTRACQLYLGMRTDGVQWCQDADEAVCLRFMEFLANSGNFGNKIETNRAGLAKTIRYRTIWSILSRLQYFGEDNWKLLKKHPWLRPFAWLYQIFRFMNHIFTRGYDMSFQSVTADRKWQSDTEKLCQDMGLKNWREA